MQILVVGGFLGSGKTTIINKLLRGLVASGKTAAVIENEIGEFGIDDRLVGESGVKVTPLFGGCVCCQITGDLLDAVVKIKDEINPDWLVVEMTGLAMMKDIRSTFALYGPKDAPLFTVSVVDITRFRKLLTATRPLIEKQLTNTSLVLINKTDVEKPDEETLGLIGEISGEAPIISVCAGLQTEQELWELINGGLKNAKA